MFDSLDKVRADAQARLERAARDRRSPMHTPVIATGDADARIVEVQVRLDPADAGRVSRLSGLKLIARFEP